MKERLCFLAPDLQHAQEVVACLRAEGIKERHIYTIANDQLPFDVLPDGGPADDDFLPALERGIALGGATGLFLGLVAVALPPAGFIIGGGGVLLIGAMSASLGGLISGMAGAAFPNSRLKKFEADIAAGEILLMADVALEDLGRINALIRRNNPRVSVEGLEPLAPLMPG